MSKRKHKNRPSDKPSTQKASQPEVKPSLISRRNVLLGLLGFGAGTALVFHSDVASLFDEKETKKPVHKKAPQKRPLASKTPEYDEWASKIELPEINLSREPLDWSQEKKMEYLTKYPVSPESLKKFRIHFMEVWNVFSTGIEKAKNKSEREQLAEDFAIKINRSLPNKVDYLSGGVTDDAVRRLINRSNRYLLPSGLWVEFNHSHKTGVFLFNLYQVDRAQSLNIRLNKKEDQVPVYFLNNKTRQDILVNPDIHYPVELEGFTFGDSIVINEEYALRIGQQKLDSLQKFCSKNQIQMKPIDDHQRYMEDDVKTSIQHEGMHTVLLRLINFGLNETRRNRPADFVKMSNYQTPVNYPPNLSNMWISELASSGYGLSQSGHTASVVAWAMANTTNMVSYGLVRDILAKEIVHSPYVPEPLRKELEEGTGGQKGLVEAIMQIPEEEMHRIGERMAKLGLYLAQRAKRR